MTKLISDREPIYAHNNRFSTNLDKQLRAHWNFDPKAALASAGVIGVNQYGYCVLTKKDVGKVGIKIKHGILKEMISHCAELRKQQRLQDKLDAWHLKLEGPEPLEKEMKRLDYHTQIALHNFIKQQQ